ncbi:MAG: TMEM165/GDT1 family protein [Actinomycetota bacterium]
MLDLLGALGIVFVAVLGDKTQLATAGFATRHRPGPVLAGMCLGYLVVSLVSAMIGSAAGAGLPTRAINLGAAAIFIAVGLWGLATADASDAESPVGEAPPVLGAEGLRRMVAVAGSVAVALFVAELGDKTMLTTITLAARDDAVMVWIGATLGLCLAGVLAVIAGRTVSRHVGERTIRRVGGLLFVAVGVAVLVAELV